CLNRPSIMTPSKRFSGSARTAAGNATGKAVPGAGGGRHDPGGPGTRIRSGGGASAAAAGIPAPGASKSPDGGGNFPSQAPDCRAQPHAYGDERTGGTHRPLL